MSILRKRSTEVLAVSPWHWANTLDIARVGIAAREVGNAQLAEAGLSGIAILSRSKLEHRTGRRRTAVRGDLRSLTAAGLVERTHREDLHGGTTRNLYRLALPSGGGLS